MSLEVLFAEKYWDLELGAGEVRCDCDENGVLAKGAFGGEKVIQDWFSIQNGFWKKTILVSLPYICEDLEPQLDLKLLIEGNHRIDVSVMVKKQDATRGAERRISVYQSRVVKPLHDGNFEGQLYVNRDPLVICKEQVMELSIELRSNDLSFEESVAKLMIELRTLGKQTRLLFQLANFSSPLVVS